MSSKSRITGLALSLAMPLALAATPHSNAEIDAALLRLYETDRPYKVAVHANQTLTPQAGGKLFDDLPSNTQLHPSYQATYELCRQLDPFNKVDSEVSEAAIDAYIDSIKDMAPVQEALFMAGGTLKDFKAAWFRGGRGFEHIICGEAGKGDRDDEPSIQAQVLAGFHFWYMHYRYEREGRASYDGADFGGPDDPAGMADPRIVSGHMTVDFDGSGPQKALSKSPRGGFIVGNSAPVILAAGYIILRGYQPPSSATSFMANLNGKAYKWTFHTVDWEGRPSIRTFWPRFVPDQLAAAMSYAMP